VRGMAEDQITQITLKMHREKILPRIKADLEMYLNDPLLPEDIKKQIRETLEDKSLRGLK